MNIEMKTTTAILGPMTAMERARGRYMRAPDHPTGGSGDGGSDGGSSDGNGSADGTDGDDAGQSTADKLAKEFGDDTSGEADGGDDSDEDGEDVGSHVDDEDGDGSDGEDSGEGDDEGDGSNDDQDGDQPQNRSEQRIKEHEAARREAERKASEAQREADKWRRIAEGAPAAPEAAAEGEKDPNAEPDPADFEFGAADPEYIAAKAEWSALNRLRQEGEQARIRAELNTLEAKYQAAVPAALEKYPDYDEVVTKGAEGDKPAWACPPIVALGIRDSEVGTDIAYHLAKNPEESFRIAGLSNLDQAREFGRLEGGFLRDKASKKTGDGNKGEGNGAQPPKKRTAAPPPPKKNVARGSGGKFSVPPDTDDFAAFDRTYGNGKK